MKQMFFLTLLMANAELTKVLAEGTSLQKDNSVLQKEPGYDIPREFLVLEGHRELAQSCSTAQFIVDRSGSQEAKFLESKLAVKQVMQGLSSLSATAPQLGVTSFSVYGTTDQPGTYDLQQALNTIDARTFTGGGTRLFTALQLIKNRLSSIPKGANGVIHLPIFSDFNDEKPEEAKALVQAIKDSGNILFMCFGIDSGSGVNNKFMSEVCTNPEFVKYYPNTQALLQAITETTAMICGVPVPAPTQTPVKAPTAAPVKAPTSKAPTASPSHAPIIMSGNPTASPTRSPTTAAVVPPEISPPPELGLLALASLAVCLCLPCARKTTKELGEKQPEQIARDVEAAVIGNPILRMEMAGTKPLKETKPEMPNKLRVKPQEGQEEALRVHRVEGAGPWTGGFVTQKTGEKSQWGDVKGAFERAPEVEEKAEEAPRTPTPTEPQVADNEAAAKEREYLASLLPFTILMYLKDKAGLPLPFDLPEANVTSAVESFKNSMSNASCVCCHKNIAEQNKAELSAQHNRGPDMV